MNLNCRKFSRPNRSIAPEAAPEAMVAVATNHIREPRRGWRNSSGAGVVEELGQSEIIISNVNNNSNTTHYLVVAVVVVSWWLLMIMLMMMIIKL